MTYHLGVDLGTTFSAAAVARHGRAEPVTLGTNSVAVPSVAYLSNNGELVFGQPAVRRASTEPSRVAREFKRRVGDPTPIVLDGTPISAEMLMARLLAWIVAQVTATEGRPPDSLAVTHPANWGRYKLDLLKQAIRHVELTVDHLVPEPVAAANFYASQRVLAPGSVVAVYDLGGGTFDAALVRSEPSGFAITGQPDGIERLGGIDFDHAVLQQVANAIDLDLDGLDPTDTTLAGAVERLRHACVEAKEALSSEADVSIPVMLPSLHTEVRLTRGEFESMIRSTLDETLVLLRRVVASASLTPSDITAVLLVGGSSRIPLVSQLVMTELNRPIAVDARPKDAIPMGAALTADAAADQSQPTTAAALPPQQIPPPAPPPAPATPTEPPSPPAPRPHTAWWVAAAIVLVGAGILVTLLMTSNGNDEGELTGNRRTDPTSTSPTDQDTTGTTSPTTSSTDGGSEGPVSSVAQAVQVSEVTATRTDDRTFEINFSYEASDEPDDCTVTVDATDTAATCSAGTGSTEVTVDAYNTTYTFTASVDGPAGSASAEATGTSATKPLTVDGSAERWAGSCYSTSHGTSRPVLPEPGRCMNTGADNYVRMVADGTTERVLCWSQDVTIQDDQLNSSDIWLQLDDGWMSALYFSDWSTADADLPPC